VYKEFGVLTMKQLSSLALAILCGCIVVCLLIVNTVIDIINTYGAI